MHRCIQKTTVTGTIRMSPREPVATSKTRSKALVDAALLETSAREALVEYVRFYDKDDRVIVHVESNHLRLVYLNVRASRQSSSATLIQCRIDEESDEEFEEMWITSLQVSETQRRQGIGCEMVQAMEATARAMGIPAMKVYPLVDAHGFWESLGYQPDERMSRVLQKKLS